MRADIAAAAVWHEAPLIRRHLNKTALRIAVCIGSHALQAVLLYRLQAWLRQRHIPVLPTFCRRLSVIIAQVEIGDSVRIGPGLHINHGHVVIDGPVTIGPQCSISPFVTIGLDTGGWIEEQTFGAPRIGRFAFIGTGAKILGPITIGDNVRVGANAVVLCDVPDNCTAVGVPARIIQRETAFGPPPGSRSPDRA